jgi:hypothetical protein
MAEKVTIAEVTFKKEVDLKHGKFHSFNVKLKGKPNTYQYLSKSNPQSKFVVGQEVEADLIDKGNGYWDIKPVQTGGGFGGGGGAKWEDMRKGVAYLGATLLLANGKIEKKDFDAVVKAALDRYL